MKKERILLTPDIARKILEKNYSKNRKVNPSWVHTLAADIKSGRWNEQVSEYDQPLAFTDNNVLINGQHRCYAVIEANTPIYTWVQYGVPVDLYNYMDCGKVRSAKDFIDVPNATNIAALAKFVCALEDGSAPLYSAVNGIIKHRGGHDFFRTTRAQVLKKINEENDYLQMIYGYANRASKLFGNKKGPMANAFYTIDFVGNGYMLPEFVEECAKIKTTSDAIITCRAYMTQKILTKSFNCTPQWVMGCIFCAYDNFVKDSEISSFNKVDSYFKKYDALVTRARNERRKKNEIIQ